MSALSIQPTYPIFTDIDGQPLEAGYVWIGTANLDPQTNPINVYWDAALTILAPQPIRTLAGYPSNNGTPARLYVNSDYSIRVMNKNGSTVYSAPAATERYSEVVFNSNASQVIYDPAGTGAVATTVQTKLRETVSVKDFGAVGDGVADDTAAIQAAFTYQASVTETAVAATGESVITAPVVYFPSGIYLISASINVPGNSNIYGEQSVIKKAGSFTGTNGFQNNSSAFRIEIVGLQFIDFATGVYLDSSNANSGRISFTKCGFFGNTENAVWLDTQSTVTDFNDCIWRANKHDLYIERCDQTNIWGGWIQREGGQLTDDYDGAIVNNSRLRMYGTLLVPQPETILEPCWIKSYRYVECVGVRFGDEAAGFTSVNNFAAGSPDTQGLRNAVILKDCEIVSSGGGAAIRLFELPNIISLEDNLGFQQTGGTAIAWSSSIDAPTQAAIIANARSGFGLGTRFYIVARNVNDQSIAANLLEFASNNDRLRLAGRSGTAMRVEYNNEAVPTGADYFTLDAYGYDASASAAGLRAQVRIEASGTGGGTETVFANTANNSTTLVDVAKSNSTGFVAGSDNTLTLGSATNRWSEVYAGNGTINTSDEREKQDIAALDDAEKRVAVALKGLVKKFRFRNAVAVKSDAARIHVGVIAQEVLAAFQAESLDPMRYGIVCYDEWPEQPEVITDVLDEEGNPTGQTITQAYKPAGSRYGVRYEQLLAFIIASI
jgi:hypothetical protein